MTKSFRLGGVSLAIAIIIVAGADNTVAAQSTARRNASRSQEQAPLVAVHAVGSQRYSETDIAAATALKTGSMVRPQDFKTAADGLVASGAFEEVGYKYEPAGTGYVVTFELKDSEEFLPVSYDNFVWFADQQLTEEIHKRFPLFKGEVSTNDGMLEKVSDALQSILTDRGIAGTVRFMQEGTFGHGKFEGKIRSGLFTVEGLTVSVRQVNFPGAAEGDMTDLQNAAQTLLKSPYQRSIATAFAEKNLRPIYARRGYLKAAFAAPELKLLNSDGNAPEVSVSIAVQPGAQYRVGKIRWWGNKSFDAADLQRQLTVQPGAVADALQTESDLEKVKKLYGSRGYLRASVAVNPAFDDSDNTVNYEFAVHEGDVYRLHGVEISGVGLGKDAVARLREAWQMREGEPYDAGYEREYVKHVRTLLAPNVSVEMDRDISDENRTVDVNMNFVVHADKVIREPVK